AVGEHRGAAPEQGGEPQPGATQRIVCTPAYALPQPGQLQRGRRLPGNQQCRHAGQPQPGLQPLTQQRQEQRSEQRREGHQQPNPGVHMANSRSTISWLQPSGLSTLAASRPTSSDNNAVMKGGSNSIQWVSKRAPAKLSSCQAAGLANQPRQSSGRKYMAFSSAEPSSTSTTQSWPTSSAPRPRVHLLIKPAMGGTPIIPSAATLNAAIVQGIRRPTPSISRIRWMPRVSAKLPAQ